MPTITMKSRNIATLEVPEQGRIEYFDTNLTGLAVRVSDKGRKTWCVLYRVNGRRGKRRLVLGTYPNLSLADARGLAKAALRAAEKGIDPAERKKRERSAKTFSELADLYVERHAKVRKRSWKVDQRIIAKDLKPAFGRMRAADVRRGDVRELLDKIAARGAPIQANRTLEVVRKLYNWAVGQEYVETSPCDHVEKPSSENSRDRVLGDAEIRAIWEALASIDPVVAATYKLRFLTAARGGEILEMRREEIAGEWWTVPASRSKNGLSHRVYLTQAAREEIAGMDGHNKGGEWIFPGPANTSPIRKIYKDHAALCEAAQVKNFIPHDIRRTVATNLGAMGFNRLVIGKVLNHVERGVTSVYDRASYDGEKKMALEAWAGRLGEIIADKQVPSNVVELARA